MRLEEFCNVAQRGSGQGHPIGSEQHEGADAACLTSLVFNSPCLHEAIAKPFCAVSKPRLVFYNIDHGRHFFWFVKSRHPTTQQTPAFQLPQSRIQSFGACNSPASGLDVIKEGRLAFGEPATVRLELQRKKLSFVKKNQIGQPAYTERLENLCLDGAAPAAVWRMPPYASRHCARAQVLDDRLADPLLLAFH